MRRHLVQLVVQILCVQVVCLAAPRFAVAQTSLSAQMPTQVLPQSTTPPAPDSSAGQSTGDDSDPSDPLTVFPHSETSRYWISGQANVILQWHPTFPAKYSGPNSLSAPAQSATTHVLTLYTGYELTHTTEVFADVEYATGGGIGTALGVAGYTNLDSVRTVQGVPLAEIPYLARLMLRQIIPLTHEHVAADRDELHLATSLPARRIEFRIGKFDLVDFFDQNSFGSDSHLQFLNWTVDNNGAYDYAANTRGYTDGAILEYDDHWWTARFAEVLEPKIANGDYLEADIAKARAANLELEARGKLIAHRAGVVRLLSYLNQANMGNYNEAIAEFLNHRDLDARHHRHAAPRPAQIRLWIEFGTGCYISGERLRTLGLERWPQRNLGVHRRRPHARTWCLCKGQFVAQAE